MTDSTPSAPPARASFRRYLAFGLPLFLAAGAFYVFFWPRIETSLAINGLASEDPVVSRDLRQRLRTSTESSTDRALLDAVDDDDRPFRVRLACADLLLERNRLMALEDLARKAGRTTRSVIYTRLSRENFFRNEILPDPGYAVADTVLAWLADRGSERRSEAIRLALELELPDAMTHIRPLLSRAAAEGAGRSDANETLIGAAEAVARFKDCGSVEQVAALADADPSVHVRLRTMEVLERLVMGPLGVEPLCPGGLSEEKIAGIITRALDAGVDRDFTRNMRIKGMAMLERHPQYLPPLAARVRGFLDGDGNGAERRAALSALVNGKDAAIGPDLPRYVHDRNFEVRSTAVQVSDKVEGLAAPSLWIGVLRDETQAFEAVRQALIRLKLAAGRWVGLPERLQQLSRDPVAQEKAIDEFLEEQYRTGASQGVARDAWSDAWFRWYAESQELAGAELERALQSRRALRSAMDRGDAAAVREALAAVPIAPGGARLFLYEEAWLASRP